MRPCRSPSAVLWTEDQPPWQRVPVGRKSGQGTELHWGLDSCLPAPVRVWPGCAVWGDYVTSLRLSHPEMTARTLRDGPQVTDTEMLSSKREAFIEHLPRARHSVSDRGHLSSPPPPTRPLNSSIGSLWKRSS